MYLGVRHAVVFPSLMLAFYVQGLYVTLDKWKTAIFRIGFLIEGRTDEEQPEHMLGCGILKGEFIVTIVISSSGNCRRFLCSVTVFNQLTHHLPGIQREGSALCEATIPPPVLMFKWGEQRPCQAFPDVGV